MGTGATRGGAVGPPGPAAASWPAAGGVVAGCRRGGREAPALLDRSLRQETFVAAPPLPGLPEEPAVDVAVDVVVVGFRRPFVAATATAAGAAAAGPPPPPPDVPAPARSRQFPALRQLSDLVVAISGLRVARFGPYQQFRDIRTGFWWVCEEVLRNAAASALSLDCMHLHAGRPAHWLALSS